MIKEHDVLNSLWQSHGDLVVRITAARQGLCASFALIRKERGLTFREVAALADVDESNLSKFEKGRWSSKMAEKLFKAYSE